MSERRSDRRIERRAPRGEERRASSALSAADTAADVATDVAADVADDGLDPEERPAQDPRSKRGVAGFELPTSQQLVLWGLAAVFVGVSVWCVVLFGRALALRADLARHMDWLRASADLATALQPDHASSLDPGAVDAMRRRCADLLGDHGAPDLVLALQRLDDRLGELGSELERAEIGVADASDDFADAAFGVLTTLPDVDAHVLAHVVDLYAGLEGLWSSVETLVVLCLLLCASNLGLLYLVHRRRTQLQRAHDRVVSLASHDPLTGAWNRGAILRILRLELARSERSGRPLGVLLLDLDDFRGVNRLVGSREADHVLVEVSRRLGTYVRPYDTLGRLGGDSFLVVLPNCDQVAIEGVGERLLDAIRSRPVDHAHGSLDLGASAAWETIESSAQGSDPSTGSESASESASVDADSLVHALQERVAVRQARPSG